MTINVSWVSVKVIVGLEKLFYENCSAFGFVANTYKAYK